METHSEFPWYLGWIFWSFATYSPLALHTQTRNYVCVHANLFQHFSSLDTLNKIEIQLYIGSHRIRYTAVI